MASGLKWSKIRNDLMDDHMVKQIIPLADISSPFVVFMRLMLQSGYHNGVLKYCGERNYTIEELARECEVSVDKMNELLTLFVEKKLVAINADGEIIMLKSIGRDDSADRTPGAERVARWRRRQKEKAHNGGRLCVTDGVTNKVKDGVTCNVTSNGRDKNIDIKNTPTNVGVEESGLAPAAVAETVFEGSHVGESTFAKPAAQNAGRVPTTREEVAAYIRFVNEKCNTKVSETEERDFWDFIVMRNSDPTKRVVTKDSIGRTLHAFLEIRHRQAQKDEREAAERRRNEIGHLVTSNEIQQNIASVHQETDEEFEARLEAQRKADAEELRIVREKLARGALDEL